MSEDPIGIPRPRIKLRRPPSPGSTLKIIAAIVAVLALCSWFFSGSSGPQSSGAGGGQGEGADPAAVEAILSGATESSPGGASLKPDTEGTDGQAGGETTATVSGVSVQFSVPEGWVLNEQAGQVFIRESAGTRLCQITGKTSFDLAGFEGEVKGQEANFESAYLQEMLVSGVQVSAPTGADVHVEIEPHLLLASYTADTIHYVVRAKATLFLDTRRVYLRNVIANVARGKNLARMQCSNMSADQDSESQMENLAGSLRLVLK